MDTVSIVIPCFDQAEYLPGAIESALAQTVPPHEIIVVNDGSTDNTSDVARGYPVTLIEQRNRGVSAARNAGIRAATGVWVATLDADDALAPRFIERMVGKDDIVSCVIRTVGARSERWAPPREHPVNVDFVRNNQIICCSLFRREVWERIGGNDEAMLDGYEDWDFWTRATFAGFTVTVVDEELFRYRVYDHDRSERQNSVDRANKNAPAIIAYMDAKWKRLGMP
jgi:glycosyltransferase involved in cell wall biosynthesis